MTQPTQPTQPQVNIAMKDTKPILCECGCEVFDGGVALRSVSAFVSPTGKEEVLPVQIFYCRKCLKKFEPPQKSALVS